MHCFEVNLNPAQFSAAEAHRAEHSIFVLEAISLETWGSSLHSEKRFSGDVFLKTIL